MRYKAIVEQIEADIREDRLMPGQKMPSLRQLASQHQVSMTTALNSYRSLEENGWVVARPQSGFFVATPSTLANEPRNPHFVSKPSLVPSYSNERLAMGVEHVSSPFGISQLDPIALPNVALEKSIRQGMQLLGSDIHRYQDAQGLHLLRSELASHFSDSGFPLVADDLVITGGCIDAVRLALEVSTSQGDGVAISSPCFNGLLELLANLKRKVVEIPCIDGGIDLEQLERHIQNGEVKAGLFSSSHMNPHGTCLSVRQKQELAELANRYRVAIIEDDIYAELAYNKTMPLPIKFWDKNGYVLWCGSISKTLSAGFRVGWCSAGRFQAELLRQHRVSNLGLNSVVQAGLAQFIKSGKYKKHLNNVRGMLFQNTCSYSKVLIDCLPSNAAVSQPSGGMVLWIQIPKLNADQLSRDAKEIGIDIRAGSFFTTRRLYRDCFRINAGWALTSAFDESRSVEQALRQLLQLASEQVEMVQS